MEELFVFTGRDTSKLTKSTDDHTPSTGPLLALVIVDSERLTRSAEDVLQVVELAVIHRREQVMQSVIAEDQQSQKQVVVDVVTLPDAVQLTQAPVLSVAVLVTAVEQVRVMVSRYHT